MNDEIVSFGKYKNFLDWCKNTCVNQSLIKNEKTPAYNRVQNLF
jgi:hypothetical protein